MDVEGGVQCPGSPTPRLLVASFDEPMPAGTALEIAVSAGNGSGSFQSSLERGRTLTLLLPGTVSTRVVVRSAFVTTSARRSAPFPETSFFPSSLVNLFRSPSSSSPLSWHRWWIRCRLFPVVVWLAIGAMPATARLVLVGETVHRSSVTPGAQLSGTITILNRGTEPAQVRIYQTDYRFQASGGSLSPPTRGRRPGRSGSFWTEIRSPSPRARARR